MKDLRSKLKTSQHALEQLELQKENGGEELRAAQNTVRQQEQELARLRVVLRRTEEELDQRVAHLGERCLVLEDERGEAGCSEAQLTTLFDFLNLIAVIYS